MPCVEAVFNVPKFYVVFREPFSDYDLLEFQELYAAKCLGEIQKLNFN